MEESKWIDKGYRVPTYDRDKIIENTAGIHSECIRELFCPKKDYTILVTLKSDGTAERIIIGSYLTQYVNAEECEYLVIEDWFPAGRPVLERGGFLQTGILWIRWRR